MTPTAKIRIGISSCLAGEKVRYDGEHQRFSFAADVLAQHFTLVPVCPEVEVGMPVPRETIHLEGDPVAPRVVTPGSGTDWTACFRIWSRSRLRELAAENLCGYIFKKNSPSCGVFRVKVYRDTGRMVRKGRGVFTAAFMAANPLVPVEDEERLADLNLRESFITRVFAYQRLQETFAGRWRISQMKTFHNREKLLLQVHSPRHYRELEQLVATASRYKSAAFRDKYCALFMECLAVRDTAARRAKVMLTVVKQLEEVLTNNEYHRLLAVHHDFKLGRIPLVVPLTLLSHFAEIHDVVAIKGQSFLYPHSSELWLRNHA